jgi:hypothetical protein
MHSATTSGAKQRAKPENRSQSPIIKLGLKAGSFSRTGQGPAKVIKPGTAKESPEGKEERKVIRLGSRKYNKELESQPASLSPDQDRIRFNCPRCRNRIKAQYGQEGKAYHCPFCTEAGTVPYPSKPYEKAPADDPRSWQNQKGALYWVFAVLLLIFAFTQQNVWMPMLGLKPFGTSQAAASEPAPETAEASQPESAASP